MKDNNKSIDSNKIIGDNSDHDADHISTKYNLKFKIIMFMFITMILYFFITESVDMIVKVTLLVILYFMLFVDHCNDNEGSCVFSCTDTESFDSLKTREQRIEELNDTRGKLGNFYVNCHSCGRKRILEERHKLRRDILNSRQSGLYAGSCTGSCKDREHETMSFFNNQYVDKNQIFCYNCLMDNVHNDRYFTKNYVYWPNLNDSVNGPP